MTLGFFSGSGLGISGARRRRTATGGDGSAGVDGSSSNGKSAATEPDEDEGANVGEGASSFGKTSAPGKQKPGGSGLGKLGRGIGGFFPGRSGGNPFVIPGKRSGRYTKGDLTIGESAVNQAAIDEFDESDPSLTQAQRETARYQIDEASKLRTAGEIAADAAAERERKRKENRGP